MAMFQPEMATTWLTPAVVNAAARSRSTRSRSPMRMPAARPASGSGRTVASAEAAACRAASIAWAASGGGRSTVIDRAVKVPIAPIRSRYSPYGESGRGRIGPSIVSRSPGTTSG